MELKEAITLLQSAGLEVTSQERLKNDTGHQLRINCGAVVNIYDKGTIQVQGKETAHVKAILGQGTITAEANLPREVFVVYGHNTEFRTQLEAMLRRWQLEPIFLDQLPSEGQTIIEKLENYTHSNAYGIILATADDIGYKEGHPDEAAYRVRQNVVLELGMLLALFGRKNVAILMQQIENMERPSDIQGLVYIPFKDDIAKDAGLLLAKEMVAQGYTLDIKKL